MVGDDDAVDAGFGARLDIFDTLYSLDDERKRRVFLSDGLASTRSKRYDPVIYPDKVDVAPCEVGVLVPRDSLADTQWRG